MATQASEGGRKAARGTGPSGTMAANDPHLRTGWDARAAGLEQAMHGACGRHKDNDPVTGAGV